MNEADQQADAGGGGDTAKLVVAIVLVLAGIAGFYVLQRPAGLAALAGGGRRAGARGGGVRQSRATARTSGSSWSTARVELRKVVWPTRQETSMTTTVAVFGLRDRRGRVFLGAGSVSGLGHEAVDRAGGLIVALRWYVVHAYSNFEHRVAEALKERIKRDGLEPKFGEILVPTEEVVEMRDGQKRRSERKFYPGYVLVQMEMDEETWHLVRDVPKVLGFIGGTQRQAGADLREGSQADPAAGRGGRGQAAAEGAVRARARWCAWSHGPFNDFNGVVESVNYEKNRLQVAVQILGRSTPVELDFSQVEKV